VFGLGNTKTETSESGDALAVGTTGRIASPAVFKLRMERRREGQTMTIFEYCLVAVGGLLLYAGVLRPTQKWFNRTSDKLVASLLGKPQ
jgi:hypothetical protein